MIRIYMYKKPWRPDNAMSALFLYIYINYNNDIYTRVCILITFEYYHILFLRQKYVDCKLKSAETNSKFIVIGFVGSLNIIILNIYIHYTSVCRCVVCRNSWKMYKNQKR